MCEDSGQNEAAWSEQYSKMVQVEIQKNSRSTQFDSAVHLQFDESSGSILVNPSDSIRTSLENYESS